MHSSASCGMKAQSKQNRKNLLSSLAIFTIFVCWTSAVLPCTLGIAIFSKIWPTPMRTVSRKYIWFYGHAMLFLLRPWLAVHMRNADMALRYPASVLICNHQSFLDIYLLGAQKQANVCLVAKSWPFKLLFFFAPTMRSAGYIDAESLSAEQLEDRCMQCLEEGTTLAIYPEGSRTRTGQLGKFHAGAFRLAVRSGRPVLPLIIYNSFHVFPAGSKYFRPAPIRMEFLDPVWPQDFTENLLPHRTMMRHVRNLYLERLGTG